MQSHHEPPFIGHPGATRMCFTTSCRYYWLAIGLDIAHYVAFCTSFRRVRDRSPRKKVQMASRTSYAPFELASMDILGSLPKSTKGNKIEFLLVMIDTFTKTVRSVLMENYTAPKVAQVLFEHWCSIYGIPRRLSTNRDPKFSS